MKCTELRQRMFFERRLLKLSDKGLSIYEKDKDGEFTNFFDYDNFTGKIRLHTQKKSKYLIAGLCVSSFGIIRSVMFSKNIDILYTLISGFVVFMIGMFWVFLYFATIKKSRLLHTGESEAIFIRYNKPSEKAVEDFIRDFVSNRREFYRSKYFLIDNTSCYEDEVKKIKWLHSLDMITDSEKDLMLEELEDRHKIEDF